MPSKSIFQQDSPIAGNRKRHHPWYNLSKHRTCPGGYPSPGWGVPHPDLARGVLVLARGYPWDWDTPHEGTWDQSLEYPQKGHGTSGSIMGWRWGTPWKGHGTSGSIMGWRWGTPPR